MSEQLRARIPAQLFRAIQAVAASEVPVRERFEAIVMIVHGGGLFAASDTVDPTALAIPQEQWEAIATVMMEMPGVDGLGKVQIALDWMNVGPSSYLAPEVTVE